MLLLIQENHQSSRISRWVFQKNLYVNITIIRDWGELIHEKLFRKISCDTIPLNTPAQVDDLKSSTSPLQLIIMLIFRFASCKYHHSLTSQVLVLELTPKVGKECTGMPPATVASTFNDAAGRPSCSSLIATVTFSYNSAEYLPLLTSVMATVAFTRIHS